MYVPIYIFKTLRNVIGSLILFSLLYFPLSEIPPDIFAVIVQASKRHPDTLHPPPSLHKPACRSARSCRRLQDSVSSRLKHAEYEFKSDYLLRYGSLSPTRRLAAIIEPAQSYLGTIHQISHSRKRLSKTSQRLKDIKWNIPIVHTGAAQPSDYPEAWVHRHTTCVTNWPYIQGSGWHKTTRGFEVFLWRMFDR